MIYEGAPSAHLADIGHTLEEKLKANHRCLYLNSPPMVAGMRSHLAALGLEPREHIERGALILSSDHGHLVDGKFDVNRMLQLLEDAVKQALREGYDGLWAAGDMTWEFGNESNFTKLLEYERKLERFMQRTPALSGVCLYHCDTLPPHVIRTAWATHTSVYVNATLSRLNSRYEAVTADA